MSSSRAIRSQLGFPFDTCIRLHIPPCQLVPWPVNSDPHVGLMRALRWRTRKPQELFVYDPARNLTIYIEYSRYHMYEFSVVTHITLIATKQKPEWVVNPGSQERTIWYNHGDMRRFQDETVGTFTYYTDVMPDLIFA